MDVVIPAYYTVYRVRSSVQFNSKHCVVQSFENSQYALGCSLYWKHWTYMRMQ